MHSTNACNKNACSMIALSTNAWSIISCITNTCRTNACKWMNAVQMQRWMVQLWCRTLYPLNQCGGRTLCRLLATWLGLAWLIHSLKGGSKVSFISQVLYGWGQSGHVAATSLASGCGCHMAGRQVTRLCSMQNCTMVVLGSRTEVWQFIATWWRGEWELDQQQKALQNSKTSRKDWTSLQWIFISVLC